MKKQTQMENFIRNLPKVELHLHIEGTFEPELMFKIARRNGIKLSYQSVEELKTVYNFSDLQDFLDIYYAGANALQTEQDFYDLTMSYFEKIYRQNVIHTEIMFDPQTHTNRGIPFETIIKGIHRAQKDAEKKFGISSNLIMSFLRNLSAKSAFETLEQASDYKEWITAVGLDSSEIGHPPSKFKDVFKEARKQGYLLVAHAGEEGPPEYVWEALNILEVNRIDHGNRSLEDEKLIAELAARKMPLTVCPLSNVKLRNVEKIENHPIKKMLDYRLMATVNSDDPAYFGGYINENFLAIVRALNLTKEHVFQLVKNAVDASFMNKADKEATSNNLEKYFKQHND
ncbi:MAG: adenosine deaminase [Calditrichaeota bacterium]|nr:adenosine deaminase [Calditrichota bacterium]